MAADSHRPKLTTSILCLLLAVFAYSAAPALAEDGPGAGRPETVKINGKVLQKTSTPRFDISFPDIKQLPPPGATIEPGLNYESGGLSLKITAPGQKVPQFVGALGYTPFFVQEHLGIPPGSEAHTLIAVGDILGSERGELLEVNQAGDIIAAISSSEHNTPIKPALPVKGRSFRSLLGTGYDGLGPQRYLLAFGNAADAGNNVRLELYLAESDISGEARLLPSGAPLQLSPGQRWNIVKGAQSWIVLENSGVVARALSGTPYGFRDANSDWIGKRPPILIGDFNGDRSTDTLFADSEVRFTAFGKEPNLQALPCALDAEAHVLDFDEDHVSDVLCWSKDSARWTVYFGEKGPVQPLHLKERYETVGAPFDPDHTLNVVLGHFRTSKHDTVVFYREVAGPWYTSDFNDLVGISFVNVTVGLARGTTTGPSGNFELEISSKDQGEIRPYYPGVRFTPEAISTTDALKQQSPLHFIASDMVLEPVLRPQPCIGLNPMDRSWNNSHGTLSCSLGYAPYSSGDGAHGDVVGAACCPLPSDDILESRVAYIKREERCPENTVLTGALNENNIVCPNCGICTYINVRKYALGPPNRAAYWGRGFSGAKGAKRISRVRIPAGIRYAVGRILQDHWQIDGCIGDPAGALLTKSARRCSYSEFSSLLERKNGELVPVKMFPECVAVDNYQLPQPVHCAGAP